MKRETERQLTFLLRAALGLLNVKRNLRSAANVTSNNSVRGLHHRNKSS